MSAVLRRFGAILAADLRQRSRATRFWVVLGLIGLLSWWCFPPLESGYMTVSLGDGVRAHYSSAWVGMVLALMVSTALSLFGFYLVRGTLVRDFDTRVWQLLVATPMTRPGYLLAKWASHIAVFVLIMLIGLIIGLAVQLWRGEDRSVDLIELCKPILVLSLPAMCVTSFFAVLFDLVPGLRRTGGNVLYFFVWMTMFIGAFPLLDEGANHAAQSWLSDPSGVIVAMRDLRAHLSETTPAMHEFGISIGSSPYTGAPTLFEWRHWTIRPLDLLGRALWPLACVLGIVAMSPFLDRAAARTSGTPMGKKLTGRALRWLDPALRPLERSRGGMLVAAELKLVLRQRPLWWWLALIGLIAFQILCKPPGLAAACIGAWIISADVFARAILRERDTDTRALLFTAAGASRRLLTARIVAALVLAIVPVLPALIRAAGIDWIAPIALLMTAALVAIAGLSLGVLCRNPRPFELLLVMFGYLGAQGESTLNPFVQPASTVAQQLIMLPLFALVLFALWPRLASST
ncbi:MAG: hypothetical protein JWQ90_3272 [Hydrocarboniphaga sp.]|uniref:hypothetical protein n=1 Tax=Hydrocarboniphaga sp. TaxID=2033016 RepID=UPI00262DC2F8|nr:hypothetical protein [Hydrocarboniphaga sp.]MDB5970822.1 hypothetical protein [Hydrocarboniphaga sp.]